MEDAGRRIVNRKHLFRVLIAALVILDPRVRGAEATLSLQEAIDQALASRASLKAESDRVSVAQGLLRQARAIPNPEFQFQNENLRPGQTYTRDVDTLAMINQPLDVLGKRPARIAAATKGVARSQADYDLARWEVVRNVRLTYWAARGVQEVRDILRTTADNFQKTVDYNAAKLSVGAIPEQDLIRVRVEQERLNIAANLAAIEANTARIELLKQMGKTGYADMVLIQPLTVEKIIEPLGADQVLAQRPEIRAARAALAEAEANARLQDVAARPDLNVTYGYKRTELPDTTYGVNTAIVSVRVTLPVTDKNQGNRAAAQAEVRRQQDLLAATENDIRMEYSGALEEFQMRRAEVVNILGPLRRDAAEISRIASAAYAEGGVDLLRFLDAERARLDADLAWVRGMADYWQSVAKLEAAEGVGEE
jgi:outer membrane protein, heavy metal efflux system